MGELPRYSNLHCLIKCIIYIGLEHHASGSTGLINGPGMLVAPGQGMGGTQQNFNKAVIQTESHSGSAQSKTRFKSTVFEQNDMTMKKLWKQSTPNALGNPLGL